MPRDPRHDILFEPIKIGPVTAKNRFFQVPHCNGMGHARPQSHAAMRGIKAEGGWAVVSTEEVEIHPTSDVAPFIEGRLWDDRDIPALELMTQAVHRHGALAAIELAHAGMNANNVYSREISIAPSHIANPASYMPTQARAMRKSDIREFRHWHRNAAVRARRAGFDIVYVYAGHGISLPMHFLQSRYNHRTDEYGGSLVNRVRLLRELIEDTKEAVGGDCAVAVRLAVDELLGAEGIRRDGEGREIVEMLAELPDLWDVNVSDWANDSKTSRFAQEGFQEDFVRFVKSVTTKLSWVSDASHPRTPWCRRSAGAFLISSGPPAPPSRIPSCRGKSKRGTWMTFVNASGAIFAYPATTRCRRFVAHRIRPWARNGAKAGIPRRCHPDPGRIRF
jgi:dimethylamine/trimethylamine dehydrogenase